MEIDETEEPELKSFSKTIMVILAVSVVSIFMVVILGVWGYSVFSENNVEPVNIGMPLLAGNNVSENNEFEMKNSNTRTLWYDNVLVAQYCLGSEKDVAAGWINFDIEIPGTLPICITDCYLESWNMTAFSYGGYHPADCGTTTMTLNQNKGSVGTVDVTWTKTGTMGVVDLCCTDWWTEQICTQYCWCECCIPFTDLCIKVPWWICGLPDPFNLCHVDCDPPECKYVTYCIDAQWCTFDIWEASFSVDKDGGNEAIQLEANHLPVVTSTSGCACGPELFTNPPQAELDKKVTLTFSSDWAGCGDSSQCFEII